jgi:hypothetical protein
MPTAEQQRLADQAHVFPGPHPNPHPAGLHDRVVTLRRAVGGAERLLKLAGILQRLLPRLDVAHVVAMACDVLQHAWTEAMDAHEAAHADDRHPTGEPGMSGQPATTAAGRRRRATDRGRASTGSQAVERTIYACCDDPSPATGDRAPYCAACDTTLTPEQAAALDCEHPEVAVVSPRVTDGPAWASYREGRLRCTTCGMAFCQAVITSGGRYEPASPDPCPELATGVEDGWELCDHHRREQATLARS